MKIRGFIDTSFVDWDKRVSCVVFTEGCNLKCIYCYNFGLFDHPEKFDEVPEEYILEYVKENSDFLDGVCITGGEPTLQKDLLEFCQKVKKFGLEVKLDTNGTNPKLLSKLIDEGLVDYVAMDVKAPLDTDRYSKITGVDAGGLLKNIKSSIKLIMDSGVDYEFRTTLIPGEHTDKEVGRIAEDLGGASRYCLQKFQPQTRFEELNKNEPQTDEEMEELAKTARKHIEQVEWRGK